VALLLVGLSAAPAFAQTRIASDFEIAKMERQLATSPGFLAQLSGRLNLGDLRATRNEHSLARLQYARAVELAEKERTSARASSDLTRYSTATAYAALAQAKLGRAPESFALLEEATRYTADSPKTWNLYSSAMSVLKQPRKAVSAARNAVLLAGTNPLDVAVYQHALATALIDAGERDEAERLLVTVTASLRSPAFDAIREGVARQESFEILSTARGDEAAYLSLLNRAQLRLARLYEDRGATTQARAQYEAVLRDRTDDATALAALARLDKDEERYAEAFAANPFSLPLIRDYQRHLGSGKSTPQDVDTSTTGGKVRRALVQMSRGEKRAARTTLEALAKEFPSNDTVALLLREASRVEAVVPASASPSAGELRALINGFDALRPEQRAVLDAAVYTSIVLFEGEAGSVFESGTVDGVPFRFSEPTQFNGTWPAGTPLQLTYRVLGATRAADADALLLEPVGLAVAP
jgi:tetratricopeptide (TPR) repeat protein